MEVTLDGFDQTVNAKKRIYLWPSCDVGMGQKPLFPYVEESTSINQLFSGTRFWLISMLLIMIINQNRVILTGLYKLMFIEPCPGKPCRRWNYAFALDGVALGIPSNQKNMTEGFGGWYVKHWPSFSEMVYRKSCRKPRKKNGCEKDGFRLRFPVNQSIESWK